MINEQKVQRAIELQTRINTQIDVYGQATNDVVDVLMSLLDGFNDDEQDMFIIGLVRDPEALTREWDGVEWEMVD